MKKFALLFSLVVPYFAWAEEPPAAPLQVALPLTEWQNIVRGLQASAALSAYDALRIAQQISAQVDQQMKNEVPKINNQAPEKESK